MAGLLFPGLELGQWIEQLVVAGDRIIKVGIISTEFDSWMLDADEYAEFTTSFMIIHDAVRVFVEHESVEIIQVVMCMHQLRQVGLNMDDSVDTPGTEFHVAVGAPITPA